MVLVGSKSRGSYSSLGAARRRLDYKPLADSPRKIHPHIGRICMRGSYGFVGGGKALPRSELSSSSFFFSSNGTCRGKSPQSDKLFLCCLLPVTTSS